MYFRASRTASNAIGKQSAGVAAASTTSGHSPCRPYMAASKSACSVFVGMPVLGPARWTLMTTSGSSAITARPNISAFSEKPGPLVPVAPTAPPKDAPMAAPQAAISSSVWSVSTSYSFSRDNSCRISLAGVIG